MIKPTVIIDGLVFENQHQIGIWRVFFEVMSRTANDVNYFLLLSSSPMQPMPDNVEVLKVPLRTSPYRRRELIKKYYAHKQLEGLRRRFANAIWHSSFFTRSPLRSSKTVVHVYDTISEHYFGMNPGLELQRRVKSIALQEANAILVISNSTAEDFCKFYPLHASNTYVARLGSEHLAVKCDSTILQRENVCIYVGGRGNYKNFVALVKAVADSAWPKHIKVKVVGVPFTDGERELFAYYGISDRFIELGEITDAALARLYLTSLYFIFPSFAEGFGLPILEAQANSCIPVLSDIPVFKEVGGCAAAYFDPASSRSLAIAVAGLNEGDRAMELQRRCQQNARLFSWDATAEATLRCYHRVWCS